MDMEAIKCIEENCNEPFSDEYEYEQKSQVQRVTFRNGPQSPEYRI